MKKKYTRSISSTLAIAFFILSISALLIAGTFQIYIHWQTQSKTVAANQQLIAENAANTVANFIQKKFSIMDTAISLGHWTLGSQKESQHILESMLGLDDSFRNLVCLDSAGRKTAIVSRQSQLLSAKYLEYINHETFMRLKQTKRYISSISIDKETYEPLVTLATWTTDIFDDFKGIMAVEVNLKFIWNLVDSLKIGENGQSYVVNRKGDLLASKDITRVIRGENMGHVSKVAEFINDFPPEKKNEASLYRGMDDIMVIGTFVALDSPDWAVVTELPVKEAYREVIKSILVSAAILLLVAVAAVCIGFLVSRRLATPLINLTSTASRIAKGETGLVASIEGPREISILGDAFNNMTRQLSHMLNKEENRARELQREIDQRKLAEEKLRLNEERLDLAMHGANDGIWDWNPKNNIVYFDSRYYTMAGYEPNEFPGALEEWEKRLHPDDIESVKSLVNQYLTGESETYEIEFRFLRKDGNYMWIRGKGKIVSRDKEGNPNRFVGTHSDINERKQAEKARDEAYTIINSSPLIAFVWRNEEGWPVEFVTDNIENVLGYYPDELLSGKIRYEQIVHPDDLDRVGQEVATFSAEKNRQEFVHEPYRVLTKKGKIRWVDDRTYIRRDEAGKITHYQGIILDITERKQTEEALLESEEKYSSLFQDSIDGIFIHDIDGNIMDANQRILELFGYTETELASIKVPSLHPVNALEKSKWAFETINQKGFVRFEIEFSKKNGEVFPAEVSSSYVDIGGRRIVQGIVRDITERRQAEEALRNNEQLLSNIIESMQEGILVLNKNYEYTHWNRSMVETAHTPREEVLGTVAWEKFPFLKGDIEDAMKGAMQGKVLHNVELKYSLPDGKEGWTRESYFPLKDSDDNINGVVGVIEEITERKHAEDELRSLRNYLTNIIDSMPSALVGVDLNGRDPVEQDRGTNHGNRCRQSPGKMPFRYTSLDGVGDEKHIQKHSIPAGDTGTKKAAPVERRYLLRGCNHLSFDHQRGGRCCHPH